VSTVSNLSNPVAVYVHIPFCVRKCPYCDFLSIPYDSSIAQDYLKALESEIRRRFPDRIEASTLYLGGGTPTALSHHLLEKLLKTLFSYIRLVDEAEVSIESNPGTIDLESAKMLNDYGINRVSIGVQSFQNKNLRFLGRVHDSKAAFKSYEIFRNAGFNNINLDLIYGLPKQSLSMWRKDLETAVSLSPQHISAYSLTVEESTPLHASLERGDFKPLNERTVAKMMVEAMRFLEANGFRHYEVSNYAKQGFECMHNLAYWRYQNYIGLGASAVSFDGISRKRNLSNVSRYIEAAIKRENLVEEDYVIVGRERAAECLFLGLRTSDGVSETHLKETTGFSFADFSAPLEKLKNEGLIVFHEHRIAPTEKGFLYNDTIGTTIE